MKGNCLNIDFYLRIFMITLIKYLLVIRSNLRNFTKERQIFEVDFLKYNNGTCANFIYEIE